MELQLRNAELQKVSGLQLVRVFSGSDNQVDIHNLEKSRNRSCMRVCERWCVKDGERSAMGEISCAWDFVTDNSDERNGFLRQMAH